MSLFVNETLFLPSQYIFMKETMTDSSHNREMFIDVDKVFREKNPRAYKWTPRFVVNYIKRIVHQNEINAFQEKYGHLREYDYLDEALRYLELNITYEGLEHVPETGGCILACNHPLGGLDGLAMMQTVALKRRDVRFLVNDILMNMKNFGELFVPVNKMGANSTDYRKTIEKAFGGNHVLVIFPAGLVSRRTKGVIKDLEWKKGFITKAVQYKKPVLPVYVEGRLSNWFYGLSNFRKKIGVKANIELLYLADEMFKQKKAHVHLKIGPPVHYSHFGPVRQHQHWCNVMREYVYELKKEQPQPFETFAAAWPPEK
jgi:1-acyl-sn-glycerol-3-phosphate acyltransferase